MAGHELIDDYLADVARRLRWRPDADAVVDELRDHLYSAVERRTAAGVPSIAAQKETLTNFGQPGDITMDFATTGTKGLAVPTSFSVAAGRMGPLIAAGWLLVAAFMTASDFADRASGTWEGTPQQLWIAGAIALLISAVLSTVVVIALVERHGGLGVVGHLGIGLAALGAAAAFVGWFFAGWGSLIGLGSMIMAIALWRRSLAPRWPTMAFGASWLVAGAVGGALRILEVGEPDAFGDYRVALLVGLTIGCAGYAMAMFGLGRWLGGEAAISQDMIHEAAVAERSDVSA